MAAADVVTQTGPGGCPVLHGFNPMDRTQIDDPGQRTAIARREAPVFFSPAFGCYVVTRHEDVARIMGDMRLFAGLSLTEQQVPSRAADVLPQGFLGRRAGMLAWNDPDEHARIRKLAQRAFTRKAALANEQRIRELFDATVDEFAGEGRADLLPVFARRCPMRVMIAILGIDPAVEDRLHTWTRDTMRLMGDPTLDEDALVELAHRQADFEAFVNELIAERRAAPRAEGDLISDLLRSQDDEGGRGLDDEEVFATVALSIVAGGDTSVNLIGQLVARMLDGEGELWREIAADRSRLDLVLEEELRHSHVGRLAFRRPTASIPGARTWSATSASGAARGSAWARRSPASRRVSRSSASWIACATRGACRATRSAGRSRSPSRASSTASSSSGTSRERGARAGRPRLHRRGRPPRLRPARRRGRQPADDDHTALPRRRPGRHGGEGRGALPQRRPVRQSLCHRSRGGRGETEDGARVHGHAARGVDVRYGHGPGGRMTP
jgi:cytochrome P450